MDLIARDRRVRCIICAIYEGIRVKIITYIDTWGTSFIYPLHKLN